jgi:hypothetical protein
VRIFKEGPTLSSDTIFDCKSVIGASVGILYYDRGMSARKPYNVFIT